jgi:hypothetical protein
MARTLLMGVLLLSFGTVAQVKTEPKLKGSTKQHAPKLDLGIPQFDALPKGDDMTKVEEKAPTERATTPPGQAPYTIVSVQHGKGFIRTPTGSRPSAPSLPVTASGTPLITEKFSTVVRVKAPEKKNTSIEVALLDARGDTVMDAQGQLTFKNDEADWTVDWAPTGIRATGEFQVLIRIGGNPLGTFPLKIETKSDTKP